MALAEVRREMTQKEADEVFADFDALAGNQGAPSVNVPAEMDEIKNSFVIGRAMVCDEVGGEATVFVASAIELLPRISAPEKNSTPKPAVSFEEARTRAAEGRSYVPHKPHEITLWQAKLR